MNKKVLIWRIVILGAIVAGLARGISGHITMSRLAHDLRYGSPEEQISAAKELMARDRLFDVMQEMPRVDRIRVLRTVIRRIPGELTVKQCLILLKDPRVTVRNRVAAALVVLGKDHIGILVPALRDSDENVRKGVASALVAIGAPVVPYVREAVKAPDLRAAACDVLVQIGEPSVPAFVRLLKDKDQDVRMAAAVSLGKIGSMKATPALLEATRDIESVRRVAISSLCTICDPRGIDLFVEVLRNPEDDGEVRARAARALSVLDGEKGISALVDSMDDYDLRVKSSVISGLQRIGAPAVPKVLGAMARSQGMRHAGAQVLEKIDAPEATDALLRLASDSDPVVRLSVARGLGERHNVSQIEPLIKLLGDADGRVAEAASESLGLLGRTAVPRLISVLSSQTSDIVKYRAACALVQIGSDAVPALREALKSSTVSAKWAAYALGQIGDRSVRPDLERLARSTDPDLKWTAERALQHM